MSNQEQQSDQIETPADETVAEDYLTSLFNGETLTEAFKEKAKVIFTAALNEKVSAMEQAILQANAEVLKEELESGMKQSLEFISESVDQYLTLASKEWLVENKLEIESGLRTEIAENFINGLKDLFENSFVEVPEEKRDLVDDLFTANRKVEESLNAQIAENMQLKAAITSRLCAEQFMNISSDLADTDVERLAKLAEGIEFDSVEQYAQKVSLLKESYFGNGVTTQSRDTEESASTSKPVVANTALMEGYVSALSRQLKLTNHKK